MHKSKNYGTLGANVFTLGESDQISQISLYKIMTKNYKITNMLNQWLN